MKLIQTYRESDNLIDWLQRFVGAVAVVENYREIGGTNNPAFINSWVNFNSATHSTAAFYKDPYERVWLKGTIKTGATPSVAFVLPTGYRPLLINTFSSIDGTGTPSAEIEIDASGNVTIASGNNASISLDGISFRA